MTNVKTVAVKRRLADALGGTPVAVPAMRLYEAALGVRVPGARKPAGTSGVPTPPAGLRVLVSGGADHDWFLRSGARHAAVIRSLLAAHGQPVEELGAMLDFGCGCGRIIRHWESVEGPLIVGTDYNPRLVRWCAANIPFGAFSVNGREPPLGLASKSFDFVYAISVFTHLPEQLGLQWMGDLRRVLRPGAFLLLTTHGAAFYEGMSDAERSVFRRGGLVVRRPRGAGSNLCSAYHPRTYVEGTLSRGFTLEDFVPRGLDECQDLVLLRSAPD
jgi:SAM-dependent methyltransferase